MTEYNQVREFLERIGLNIQYMIELGEQEKVRYILVIGTKLVGKGKKAQLKTYLYIIAEKGRWIDAKGMPFEIFRKAVEVVKSREVEKVLEKIKKHGEELGIEVRI